MNAGELWAGSEYAYVEQRGKGENFREGANRIKVIRVWKEKEFGNTRLSTKVEVQFLDTSTGEVRKTWDMKDMIRTVRARDIMSRWENYEEERTHQHEQREKIARMQEEERNREQAEKELILDGLEQQGFDRTLITGVSTYAVTIRKEEVQRWLSTRSPSVS